MKKRDTNGGKTTRKFFSELYHTHQLSTDFSLLTLGYIACKFANVKNFEKDVILPIATPGCFQAETIGMEENQFLAMVEQW